MAFFGLAGAGAEAFFGLVTVGRLLLDELDCDDVDGDDVDWRAGLEV